MNPTTRLGKLAAIPAIAIVMAGHATCAGEVRPMIEANPDDKARVLGLVAKYDWATAALKREQDAIAPKVLAHKQSPAKSLASAPPFGTGDFRGGGWMEQGIQAGIVYFLTGDEDHAQLAADRLNLYVQEYGIAGKAPDMLGGGEMRGIYHAFGLTYDYIHPFLAKPGTMVFDAKSGKRIPFDHAKTQIMFTNIVEFGLNNMGGTSNIGIMHFDGVLFCALCIEDKANRDAYVDKLVKSPDNKGKSGLIAMKKALMKNQGLLAESASYSGVGQSVPVLMEIVDRLYPEYRIFEGYEVALLGVTQRWYFNYPNELEHLAFGDSRRRNPESMRSGDTFNRAIRRSGFEEVAKRVFGKIKADRAIRGYQPGNLWTMDPLEEYEALPMATQSLQLLHAGLAMQKNLHCADPALHGLMYYTAGGTYVHSQLSGLDLELYGAGQVMGGVGGAGDAYRGKCSMPPEKSTSGNRGTFRNVTYYRNYAGHNTVVINGESVGGYRGFKGQNGQGMDTVKLHSMEPMPYAPAVAKEFSFSCQQLDDTINKATQQRTVGMIRTGGTSGYYLDVFRSRAQGENRFHDYIYHNIGDAFALMTGSGSPLGLTPDKRIESRSGEFGYLDWQRFAAKVIQSPSGKRKYPLLSPGWHFFDNVAFSEGTKHAVVGRFDLTISRQPRHMHVLMPGGANREYTSAISPGILESMKPYDQRPAQVLSIRHHGEAWDQPFVVVFEPSTSGQRTVQSVENLMDGNKIVGAKVVSKVDEKVITDWIIAQDKAGATYSNEPAGLSFTGRFAIARTIQSDAASETILYVGDGETLTFQGHDLPAGGARKAYISIQ